MSNIYHDPNNPQCDAVERYAISPELECACNRMTGRANVCGEKKRGYHIYIMRSQLIYDVEAELSIITRSRRNEKGLQDNNIENTDAVGPLLQRWLNKYLSLAKRKLASVLKQEDIPAASDRIRDNDEIDIAISVGDWWNENALTPLTDAIHDYIVNGCLYEYLLLYLTAKDPVTVSKEQQMELSLEEIHNALLSYKPGRLRKGMHPFP